MQPGSLDTARPNSRRTRISPFYNIVEPHLQGQQIHAALPRPGWPAGPLRPVAWQTFRYVPRLHNDRINCLRMNVSVHVCAMSEYEIFDVKKYAGMVVACRVVLLLCLDVVLEEMKNNEGRFLPERQNYWNQKSRTGTVPEPCTKVERRKQRIPSSTSIVR